MEPVPRFIERLERNLALNGIRNVEVARVAVAGEPGAGTIKLPGASAANQGDASLHHPWWRSGDRPEVEITTIDALARAAGLRRVRLIKLDLEGHDLPAMLGARDTIATFWPLVVFEYHAELWCRDGFRMRDAERFLHGELGYQISPLRSTDGIVPVIAWLGHPAEELQGAER